MYGLAHEVVRKDFPKDAFRGPRILWRDTDAGAYDAHRRGVFLVGRGRLVWCADAALDRPRTLGKITTPTGYGTRMDLDSRRRELVLRTSDARGGWVGVFRLNRRGGLIRRKEVYLGPSLYNSTWVAL